MATQTFNSVSQNDWKPVSWAWPGYTADGLSSFLVNAAALPNLNPLSDDGNGGLDLSTFNAPSGTNLSTIDGDPNVGALVNTAGSFSQEYGYFEMTAKMSGTPGTISAFWMLPTDGTDPPEIDIAEVTGNSPNTLVTSSHSSDNGTFNPYSEVSNTSTGFNTYAVDWEPNTITWYFNGQQVAQEATPADMNKPMYLALDEESGTSGSWEGAPSGSFKGTMDVQSVQAYTSNPNTSGSTATMTYNSSSGSSGGSSTKTSSSATSSAPAASSGNTSSGSSNDTTASVGADSITGSAAGGMEFIYNGTGEGGASDHHYSTIPDFDPKTDALAFDNTSQSFGSIYIATASDGHAIVESDHNVINLTGVTPSQLNDHNILFNVSTS